MNQNYKIIIRGSNSINKGAEAMLRTVQTELTERLQSVSFYASVPGYNLTDISNLGVSPICLNKTGALGYYAQILIKLVCFFPVFIKNLLMLNFSVCSYKYFLLFLNNCHNFDAVIDVSGFAYSDSWGVSAARTTLSFVKMCNKRSKPYILLPQAWGTFENPKLAKTVKEICNNSRVVYSRDQISTQLLKDVGALNISEAPDIVFNYEAPNSYSGACILSKLFPNHEGKKLIVINPNIRVYERMNGEGTGNEYIQILVKVIQYLNNEGEYNFLLLPNDYAYTNSYRKDDRFLCGIIKSCFSKNVNVISITEYLSATQVKSLLAHSDLVIASRFHVLIFSLSMGKMCYALGWSHKYTELMNLVGLPDNVLSLDAFESERVISDINKIIRSNDDSLDKLVTKVDMIKGELSIMFEKIASEIQQVK